MSINFTIPVVGQSPAQAVSCTASTNVVVPNPIVPALTGGALQGIIPSGNGKAMVSITGQGATQQQFGLVYYAVGSAPVAGITNPALIAGGVYVIEGFQPGDKIAFFANGAACLASVTRIG
jgi:hypothetical protein